jgi:hypothetical protein
VLETGVESPASLHDIELLRECVHAGVSGRSNARAALDDWDLIVERHGRTTRYMPAGALLRELVTDFVALHHVMCRKQTATSLVH